MKKFRDLAIFLFFSLSVMIIILGSLFNYYLSPVNRDIIEQEIEITDGKDIDNITMSLYNKKLIRNPKIFKFYLKIYKIDEMKEGSFTLSSNMNSKDIAKSLSATEQ